MQAEPLEQVVRNVDARLTRVEQILPTLATKAEMRTAIAEAIVPLATKEELKAAIAPLATKEEMRTALAEAIAPLATKADVAEEGERSRRFAKVLFEQVRSDIALLAEHLSGVMRKLEGY